MYEIIIQSIYLAGFLLLLGIPCLVVYYKNKSKASKESLVVLDKSLWKKLPLIQKSSHSHNTSLLGFALPSKESTLGLSIGQHIGIKALINDKAIQRCYTPVSSTTQKGSFELLVKHYQKGNMSRYLETLELGQCIEVNGPRGSFLYKANSVKELGMLAGGTGIAPMFQIIKEITFNPNDNTKISLIYANVSEADILLKEELEALCKTNPRLSIYYVLNTPPSEGWNGGAGFISAEMIQAHMPLPGRDMKILLCGPPPMMMAMGKLCASLGYDPPRPFSHSEDMVYKFQ